MKRNAFKVTALLGSAALLLTAGLASAEPKSAPIVAAAAKSIPGWPAYIAMGAIGGPNVTPPTLTSTGGDDDFGGKQVDVVFKYAGFNGAGDPGIIVAPTNSLRMTSDLTTLSAINARAMRVAIVEYTAQLSGGISVDDFTNSATPTGIGGTYLMARHLISMGADALALNDTPVVYNGQRYYGTLIMNPDMLGAIQQGGHISQVNNTLLAGQVNINQTTSVTAVERAVDQAMCFLTTTHLYQNLSNPNGVNAVYVGKWYNGTPVAILEQMYADGYPAWSLATGTDAFWNAGLNNLIGGSGSTYSQVGTWFNDCVTSVGNQTYRPTYQRPNFPATLDGWIQANNWIIRMMSPKGRVTFGWQENMWAVTNSYWLHADLTDAQIASTYSTPISTWLQANAPSAITTGPLGANYVPDYFLFDRYETDDSAAPGVATLYNARSWDNYLTAVGQISKNFNNIPIMLWQIPGSHIPYSGEANPELLNNTAGQYIFSTAPVYFFGDSNLQANLGNMIAGTASSTNANTAVGNFLLDCGSTAYNCTSGSTYKQYLLAYKGQQNNYNWASGNGRLAFAASNNVFAILWGGGNTTNVIKNFSNPDDHGWLANKLIAYYQNPTPLQTVPGATTIAHDFNGDAKSDILWRNTTGNNGMWPMTGPAATSIASLLNVSTNWSIVGQRDFNGDGTTDLLWASTAGDVAIWLMNGSTIQSVAGLGNVGTNWAVVGTADFNGDGKGDILWRSTAGANAIWLMNGTTVSSIVGLGAVPTNWSVAGTADFDGDGKGDILWRNAAGDNAIWLMNGATISSVAGLGNVGTNWSIVGTADFDGNGKGDILWRNAAGDNAIWLMNGTTIASVAGLGNIPTNWSIVSNGDYNGDGKGDILWRSSGGDNAIWFMNGTTLMSILGLTTATPYTGAGSVPTNWSVQNAAAN